MKTVHKSVLIWFSAQEMFDLVTDVPSYPKFLPWCDQARIVAEHERGVDAEIGLAFSGIHQKFMTHNVHTPGREVQLTLLNGPFSHLDGQWTFNPVGDATQRACKVELSLSYDFSNITLGKLIGPVFDRIAGSLMDAFVKRAEQVYAH